MARGRDRDPPLPGPEPERHPLQQHRSRTDLAKADVDLPQHLLLDEAPNSIAHRRRPERFREEGRRPVKRGLGQRGRERLGQSADGEVRRPVAPVDVGPPEHPVGVVRRPRLGLRRGLEEDPAGGGPVDVGRVQRAPAPAVLDHHPRGPPLSGEPGIFEPPPQRRDGGGVRRDVQAQVADAAIDRPGTGSSRTRGARAARPGAGSARRCGSCRGWGPRGGARAGRRATPSGATPRSAATRPGRSRPGPLHAVRRPSSVTAGMEHAEQKPSTAPPSVSAGRPRARPTAWSP